MHTPKLVVPQGRSPHKTCGKCGLELPLREPRAGDRRKTWHCNGCSTPYDAVLDRCTSLALIHNIRPTAIDFGKTRLPKPPGAIEDFIRKWLSDEGYQGRERRKSVRHRIAVPAVAMPIDEGFDPAGGAFMVMARNISSRGISLVGTRAASTAFLAVELSAACGEEVQLVIRVLRSQPIRRFYEIGGMFVTKVG